MNQQAPPPPPGYATNETNGLGIAGFICSLLGLLTCGLLSPVGLLLSFIAIFKQPRAFAITGLVLGIIGSFWVIFGLLIAGVGLFAAVVALVAGAVGLPHVEAGLEMFQIHQRIAEYEDANGAKPTSLDQLAELDEDDLTDPWGNPYAIEINPDTGEHTIVSAGPDGQMDTGDDIESQGGATSFTIESPGDSDSDADQQDAAPETDPDAAN